MVPAFLSWQQPLIDEHVYTSGLLPDNHGIYQKITHYKYPGGLVLSIERNAIPFPLSLVVDNHPLEP